MEHALRILHFTLHILHSLSNPAKKSTALKSGAKLAFIAEIHKENDKQNNVHYTLYIILPSKHREVFQLPRDPSSDR